MIKIGTIGTSKITVEFIKWAKKDINIKISCCYSRDKSKAKEFIKENSLTTARAVDSFEVLLDEVDAVYIASPNGLHYEQAKYFLTQQKHVLLEKPITLKYEEALELKKIAKMNNVILMDALKSIHVPQFKALDDFVSNHSPFMATFNTNTYSSRMQDIKKGIFNSVFDPKLGKGSTYDMLVYPVELAIALFGSVKEIKSFTQKLPNGVGLSNTVLLKHNNDVLTNIICSKSSNGVIHSEILADNYTLTFSNLTKINKIVMYNFNRDTNEVLHNNEGKEDDSMKYEIAVFVSMILNNNTKLAEYLMKISCETIRVLNFVENEGE